MFAPDLFCRLHSGLIWSPSQPLGLGHAILSQGLGALLDSHSSGLAPVAYSEMYAEIRGPQEAASSTSFPKA